MSEMKLNPRWIYNEPERQNRFLSEEVNSFLQNFYSHLFYTTSFYWRYFTAVFIFGSLSQFTYKISCGLLIKINEAYYQ